MLEKAIHLIREHTSQGPENGSPRYGAVASAVNGRETDGRVLENFRNLFQPYTYTAADSSLRRQLQLLKEGNGTQHLCEMAFGIPRNKGVNFHGKFGLGIPKNSQP